MVVMNLLKLALFAVLITSVSSFAPVSRSIRAEGISVLFVSEQGDDGSSRARLALNTLRKTASALATIAFATSASPAFASAGVLRGKQVAESTVVATYGANDLKKVVGVCAGVAAAAVAAVVLKPAKLTAGYGLSTKETTKDAVAEAIKMASADVSASPSIAFISCTVGRDVDEVRKEFAMALPEGVPVHGITSSAALLTSEGSKSAAIGCLLVHSNKKGAFETTFDYENGKLAVVDLKEKMKNPQVILMGSTPGAEEGVIEALDQYFPGVPVYGGTAADDELTGDWRVMCREASSGTGVSLVGVSHAVKIGASMLGPYSETGKRAIATKAKGRRVFEIDGIPAADWVYDWLGDEVKEQYKKGGLVLPQTAQKPVGVKKPSGEFVTHHLSALGGEDKYVDFFAPIAEGSELVVMDSGEGPSSGYAEALSNAYDTARKQVGAEPAAGILVFCGGMAIAVGENLDVGLSSEKFASQVSGLPMLGMTCFGEQAYLPGEKQNVQRNLSVGMILLG